MVVFYLIYLDPHSARKRFVEAASVTCDFLWMCSSWYILPQEECRAWPSVDAPTE